MLDLCLQISTTAAAKHPLSSRGTPKHHAEASPLSLEENLHPNLPMVRPDNDAVPWQYDLLSRLACIHYDAAHIHLTKDASLERWSA